MSGGAVRTDHLTFLVLAGAVALVAFAFGEVPMLLLPPAVPFSRPGAPLGAALRGRRSTLGVTPRAALGAAGALVAQEHAENGNPAAHRQRRW